MGQHFFPPYGAAHQLPQSPDIMHFLFSWALHTMLVHKKVGSLNVYKNCNVSCNSCYRNSVENNIKSILTFAALPPLMLQWGSQTREASIKELAPPGHKNTTANLTNYFTANSLMQSPKPQQQFQKTSRIGMGKEVKNSEAVHSN